MARDVSHIGLCVLYPLGQITAWSGDADDTLQKTLPSFSFSVEAYIPGSRTHGRTDARIWWPSRNRHPQSARTWTFWCHGSFE